MAVKSNASPWISTAGARKATAPGPTKQNFPADAVGRWQVQVLTEAGQMIGVLRFKVVE